MPPVVEKEPEQQLPLFSQETLKAMMKSDCDNIAVVVERYAESCQALMTDPQKRLRELSAKRTMTRRE